MNAVDAGLFFVLAAAALSTHCGGRVTSDFLEAGGIARTDAEATRPGPDDGQALDVVPAGAIECDTTCDRADGEVVDPEDAAAPPPMDAAAPPPTDAASVAESGAADAEVDAQVQDAMPACLAAEGCYEIPTGWNLVAFAVGQSSPCPPGFASSAPTMLYEDVDASGACACSGPCSVTTQPTCSVGYIGELSAFDDAGAGNACAASSSPSWLNYPFADSCQTDIQAGDYSAVDLEFTPPIASFGQCTSVPGVQVGIPSLTGPALACVPDSPGATGCVGTRCRPSVPPPFRLCINRAPRVACPAGSAFTDSVFLMTGFSLNCGPCNCSVTASCAGTVELFSDPACANDEFDVPTDGECHGGPKGVVTSYRYVANQPTDVACVLDRSASDAFGVGAQTMCCIP